MRALKVLAVIPLWFLLTADASPAPTDNPSPQPTPTPIHAYITLDVSAGGPNTQITVSGNSFNPGQAVSVDWDSDTSKVLGSATANAQGNFSGVRVKAYARAAPGLHHLCATVNPFPCAQFTLQGTPTPTPRVSPRPTPTPSASPSPSPTPSLIAIPAGSNNNGLDVMLRPPFIFLPIFGLIALFLAIGYWLFSKLPRPQRNLPSASIVHRSARPLRGPIYPNATPPPPGDEPPTEPPWAGPREG